MRSDLPALSVAAFAGDHARRLLRKPCSQPRPGKPAPRMYTQQRVVDDGLRVRFYRCSPRTGSDPVGFSLLVRHLLRRCSELLTGIKGPASRTCQHKRVAAQVIFVRLPIHPATGASSDTGKPKSQSLKWAFVGACPASLAPVLPSSLLTTGATLVLRPHRPFVRRTFDQPDVGRRRMPFASLPALTWQQAGSSLQLGSAFSLRRRSWRATISMALARIHAGRDLCLRLALKPSFSHCGLA